MDDKQIARESRGNPCWQYDMMIKDERHLFNQIAFGWLFQAYS